jgi:hypothetical protein
MCVCVCVCVRVRDGFNNKRRHRIGIDLIVIFINILKSKASQSVTFEMSIVEFQVMEDVISISKISMFCRIFSQRRI